MLPSQPSPRARGLPSNPRWQSRPDDPDSRDFPAPSPTPNSVRAPAHSVAFPANLSRTRSRSRPRVVGRARSPQKALVRPYTQSNASSVSSSSSSASSFSLRRRQDGFSSSQTSLDDDEGPATAGRHLKPKLVSAGNSIPSSDQGEESLHIEWAVLNKPHLASEHIRRAGTRACFSTRNRVFYLECCCIRSQYAHRQRKQSVGNHCRYRRWRRWVDITESDVIRLMLRDEQKLPQDRNRILYGL